MNENKKEIEFPDAPRAMSSREVELLTLIETVKKKIPSYNDFFHPETSEKIARISLKNGLLLTVPLTLGFLVMPSIPLFAFLCADLIFSPLLYTMCPSPEGQSYLAVMNGKWSLLKFTQEEETRLCKMLQIKIKNPHTLNMRQVLEILGNMLIEQRKYSNEVTSLLSRKGIFSSLAYKAPEQVINLILEYQDPVPEEKITPRT